METLKAPTPRGIETLRKTTDWSTHELANVVHATVADVQDWESGKAAMPVATWHLALIVSAMKKASSEGQPEPETIKAFRKGMDWSQEEMAEWLGVSRASVQGWERGRPIGMALWRGLRVQMSIERPHHIALD